MNCSSFHSRAEVDLNNCHRDNMSAKIHVHWASCGRCCFVPITADVLVSHEVLTPGTFGGCVDSKNVKTR